jgi:tetratricopeptide (TPR) repeat protein
VRIGRYEVLGELARGGMGVVLRAHDPALRRDVAIKVLLRGAGASDLQRRRFEREVAALARLRHPNVVAVHEHGVAPQGPFVVMDLIQGESLEARLARAGPLPVREALRLTDQVARAVAHAHAAGILHRDLKPANVLLAQDGTPLVTDFGLARDLDPSGSTSALSKTGVGLGTPGFWPPEQAYGQRDQVGPASDVYGLAATLYALLTGQPPYDAPSVIELLGLMTDPPAPPSRLRPGLSPALDAVVLKGLAHDPAARYPTVEAFADALAQVRRQAHAAPSQETAALPARAPTLLLALAGVAAVVSVGAAAAWGLRPRPPAPRATTEPPAPVATSSPSPVSETATEPPAPVATTPTETPAPDPLAAARAALAAGRADEALRLLAGAPPGPDLFVLRSRARSALEDYAGAAQDASAALVAAPERADARLARALARRGLGDAQGVKDDVERLLAGAPRDAQALVLRAWARGRLGERQGALEDYTAAIELDPAHPDWLDEVGSLCFDLGDLDAAQQDFSLALALDGDDVLALMNRSAVLTKKGDLAAAVQDLDRALRLRPDLALAWRRRGDLHRLRDELDQALSDFDQAVQLEPGEEEGWRLRGYVKDRRGDTAGAVKDYERRCP